MKIEPRGMETTAQELKLHTLTGTSTSASRSTSGSSSAVARNLYVLSYSIGIESAVRIVCVCVKPTVIRSEVQSKTVIVCSTRILTFLESVLQRKKEQHLHNS